MGIGSQRDQVMGRIMKFSVWRVVYGTVLAAYLAAFVAVLWIGTGLGKPAPVTVAVAATAEAAADGPDVAVVTAAPTLVAAAQPVLTATSRPSSATSVAATRQ